MSNLSLMRKFMINLKAFAPGSGRRLMGRDLEGNLYFEKPDPNDPTLTEANYDDANIAVQWQSWLRNTRPMPPTNDEIQRDEMRKQLTVARAKVLDEAWQDRKAELALEQAQGQQKALAMARAAQESTPKHEQPEASATSEESAEDGQKSAARKQIEEREASRKGGFKPVQQGDTYEPQTWSPVAARRR
ncbi:hypothetical protein BGW38_005127 [Lunasporangiospora selenospora]|uniref:NADH dehydrogenase [ubiquinone] 1 alpha subcomplex subunit n=1 Tax=Lunasporangiospora selenospora TaxID=979761 RepID=A0A9P6FQD8_9FUNG|nr:hypothetical protein BGW38_005127 [Lunasporangiospora selenospora]